MKRPLKRYPWVMPKVSVIMPTYNAAPFLPRAIESVCAQTLTDWELIIVDDGSTDGTVGVIRDYLTDPRIRFLQNPQNMGPSDARNRALEVATGQWIALLDADDWYEPQRLEKMVGTAEAFKVGIVYDLLRWVDAATGEERRLREAEAFMRDLAMGRTPAPITPTDAADPLARSSQWLLRRLEREHAPHEQAS